MQTRTETGLNRTGVHMSPELTARMLEGQDELPSEEGGNERALMQLRGSYAAEAEPVGSIPLPVNFQNDRRGAVKGSSRTAKAKETMGRRAQIFSDKLGERLAFERSGVRLYDALLTKCAAAPDNSLVSAEILMHFRNEEADHFNLLAQVIAQMGGDPTAQTPSADVAGVESAGLMQVLTDARTTLADGLHAILVAELADYAGWDLLIKLAEEEGRDDASAQFRKALEQEEKHLAQIRSWYQVLALGDPQTAA